MACIYDQTKGVTRCHAELYKYSEGYGSGCVAKQGTRMGLVVRIYNNWSFSLRLFIQAFDELGNKVIDLTTPDTVAPNDYREASYFFDQPNYNKSFNIKAGWIQD
jgi:hypothetical protein